MAVIDTEQGLRKMADDPARRVRVDQGVPLASGGTLTATNVQDAIDQLAANAGGGGIADAPSDGTLYGRKNAAWTAVPPSGLADAPSDGNLYARKNAAWTVVPPAAAPVAISDTAPSSPLAGNLWWDSADGELYIYYNDGSSSQWVAITTAQSVGSGGGGGGGAGSFTTTIQGAGTYVVPSGKTTLVGEAWGAGGSGCGWSGGGVAGGGGGGYSKFSATVTPGQTIYYNVGAPGAGSQNAGINGGSSWVNPSANSLPASNGCVGGGGGGATSGAGGNGTGSVGTTNFNGGIGSGSSGGGGGGGAGSGGNGGNGSAGTGGAAGTPDGGAGGNGSPGSSGSATPGVTPGGGGGGASFNFATAGNGGNGQVRLTFS